MTQENGKKKKREGDTSVREQGAAVQDDKGRDISQQRRTWKAKQVIKPQKEWESGHGYPETTNSSF